MRRETVLKYCAPVPRYTSYPTAPHFTARVSELQYVSWLSELPSPATLSLYVHIPFCTSLCWYCGCNTKATWHHAPIASYLNFLHAEIGNVAAIVPPGHTVTHIHWGGGSPNILLPADILALSDLLRSSFNIADAAEFAVEIDPRHLEPGQVAAFAGAGVNRVSIGVQDFEPAVQAAIGRVQGFETTRSAVDAFRSHGVSSINVDLMYGLPHQTRASIERTLGQVLDLGPDRIAVFGYAHLPERLKHQRLIPEAALPDVLERYAQSRRIARRLGEHGYVGIGLDHFAKPTDALAAGPVSRNFQGYTSDAADALIGLGASAIGRFPQGYVQNAMAVGDYARRIRDYGLATARGIELSDEDRVRAHVIERLMCGLGFSAADLAQHFGAAAGPAVEDARALLGSDEDGLLQATADGFEVTERGRPFIRSICACFDAYLDSGVARHSVGV